MGYILKPYPDMEEAKTEVKDYDYALLYYPDGIRLMPAKDLSDTDWKRCTEARVFRKDAEIHFLFDEEDTAVRVSDSGNDSHDMLTKEYELAGKFSEGGKKAFRVIEYLETDDDGQSSIALTRLSELV